MVETQLDPEVGLQRILGGLGSHLEDPKVVSAVLLSAITYTRAQDVDSLLHRWINYVRTQSGLDEIDVGLSRFQKAVAGLLGGLSGYALAEGVDRLATELEIRKLKDLYQDELAVYNTNRPIWEAKDSIPEPEQPEVLSWREWLGGPEADLTPEQITFARQGYADYVRSKLIEAERWNRMHARWIEIQNMSEPIHPTLDPAIALWEGKEGGTVSPRDAATYALIAFIIGLNPSIVPEALKGVGEIVKGIGEIVPL